MVSGFIGPTKDDQTPMPDPFAIMNAGLFKIAVISDRELLSVATAAYDAVAQPSLGQNSGSSSMGRSSGSTWKRRRISSRGSLARAR